MEYFYLLGPFNKHSKSPIQLHWIPPYTQHYKLNTDRACVGNPNKDDIGGVIRNNNGEWVIDFLRLFRFATNNLMELLALKKGLELALDHNLKPLEVSIDTLKVINMLNNGNIFYDPILHECRLLIRNLPRPMVLHNFKEQNRIADA